MANGFILSAHLDIFQNVTMVKEGKKHGLVFTKLLAIIINLGGGLKNNKMT